MPAWSRPPVIRRLLALEALCLIAVATLAIAVLPHRGLMRGLTWRAQLRRSPDAERQATIARVQRAIHTASVRAPWEVTCFPKAVAAYVLLRRRAIDTTLYYGAAKLPGVGLSAHVWVQDGERGVVGHEIAGRFHVLASYAPSSGARE